MRATLERFLKTIRDRREQGEDKGFSLIELIVVVAILGILVAVAIPVFGNIQQKAAESALATVAANGATQIASAIAADGAATQTSASIANLAKDGITFAVTPASVTTSNVGTLCVTATKTGVADQKSGPGC